VIRFVAGRIAQMILVFVVFLTVVFTLLEAQPGDITDQLVSNPKVPPEARQLLAERLGLDEPVWKQYVNYLRNFATGDLGVSFSQYPRPVNDIVAERMPRTIFLFLSAVLLAYWLGFHTGKFLVWRRGSTAEHAVNVAGVSLYTVFQPWFYLVMIYLFSFILGWFPPGKFIEFTVWRDSPYTVNEVFHRLLLSIAIGVAALVAARRAVRRIERPRARRLARWSVTGGVLLAWWGYWIASPMWPYAWDIIWHSVLPISTLALVIFGGVMLLMRSSMLETLREDYVFTARAKGLPDRVIRDRHAARNALLPVVTSLVIALAFVIGGGIIAENIFSWPGMGQTLLDASVVGDVPLATGALAFIGVLALVGHLVVDVLYMFLDPRIRH
jgi:peptide/nickel transport system permease protein